MDMFVINGGKPLKGQVSVSGAKNAALPVMAASLLAQGTTTLKNVPNLVDVNTLCQLLKTLGVESSRDEQDRLLLTPVDDQPVVADYDLVRRMRASICVLGPLLAKRGKAIVSLPGGCNIGDRPINLHLKGLQALGADIRVERGYVIATANRLLGANIFLGGPFGSTVTGTCNVMSAATLARGKTTIEAAACEPEVVDLGNYLNSMGAQISGLGTPFLQIEGVDQLQATEAHAVIPDRIEAATLMIATAATGGQVQLANVELAHLTAVVEKLQQIGVQIESDGEHVNVAAQTLLAPADCIALPYPGIPTDVQAQFMALLSTTTGMSVVTDKVFPDRFMHTPELVRLGAQIRREGPSAIISGVDQLSGACVMASDLRASAALVIAALAARGNSVIRRIYHLDRGYDQLEKKLNALGADIRRVKDEPANMPANLQSEQLMAWPQASDEQPSATTPLREPHWKKAESAAETKNNF